ncbi:type I-F CRISPR-associated protein Csy1 [Candidatus Nitrosacidococcus tergens]|uniref:CRISPR-associated protein, Csy1 family n=1 Tax=Candidatus Nitrosacidococcus tergens TaxID=553981 RepID=A0A7G1Q9F4_9GAMM|nr:type I-F CRISPR-associated protein Csy1 [Candidatus Nitrosacidococcus tergens]CAB1275389.1 conserved protein of unknown function [Candidatus Nitrosacidococcus tergens]
MFIENLNQHLNTDKKSTKDFKASLLRHSNDPISVTENETPLLLKIVLSLTYGGIPPDKEWEILLNEPAMEERAKEALRTKVIDKITGGEFIWAALTADIGTHHPKSRNDKISSGSIIAHNLTPPPKELGLVTSAYLKNIRNFSGSGNGAYVAHYQWLSFTYQDANGVLSILERVVKQDHTLKQTLLDLGISAEDWDSFHQAVANHLSASNNAPLDRQLKQIFVPDPTCNGDDYLVISPLPATRMVAAFKQYREKLREESAHVVTSSLKVGGTKPQNAGSLINELGGNLHLLKMTIPSAHSNNNYYRRLKQLTTSNAPYLFLPMVKRETEKLEAWLEKDWNITYGNRQDYLDQLEKKISAWITPELEAQDQFLSWITSDTPDAIKARENLETKKLPHWVNVWLGLSSLPISSQQLTQALQNDAYQALKFKSLLDDVLYQLVTDALNRLINYLHH